MTMVIIWGIPVSKINKLVPTSDVISVGLGLGMAVLCKMEASLSSTIRSMTSLTLSAGLLVGEGLGESGMMIGLVGCLEEWIPEMKGFLECRGW